MHGEPPARKGTGTRDTRPRYEPPRALRMSALHAGSGLCGAGSGDVDCWDGNVADAGCNTGTSAAQCDAVGNSPDF